MTVVARYRRYAANCLRAAQLISDPKVRTSLIDMATAWKALAEHTDDDAPPAQRLGTDQPQPQE